METENCDVDLAEETEKSDDENKHGGHEEEADDLVSIEPCKCSKKRMVMTEQISRAQVVTRMIDGR